MDDLLFTLIRVVSLMVLGVIGWVIFGATAYLASKFRHYSLRTLLIATTAIAIALGLGVVMLRGS